MDLGISGKSALVTGSYRGTGAAIAACLADEGVKVWVHGFQHGDTEQVVNEIIDRGGAAESFEGEVFKNNCLNIGLLALEIEENLIQKIISFINDDPKTKIYISV